MIEWIQDLFDGFHLYPELILALAALLTAISGLIAAFAALRRTKKSTVRDAEEDCLRRLKEAREESETVAKELHDRRMREALG